MFNVNLIVVTLWYMTVVAINVLWTRVYRLYPIYTTASTMVQIEKTNKKNMIPNLILLVPFAPHNDRKKRRGCAVNRWRGFLTVAQC